MLSGVGTVPRVPSIAGAFWRSVALPVLMYPGGPGLTVLDDEPGAWGELHYNHAHVAAAQPSRVGDADFIEADRDLGGGALAEV